MKKINVEYVNEKPPRAIRMPETQHKTGLSKTHIYRLMKLGLFPRPFKLSERAIAFFESDIDAWIEKRKAESCT